MSKKLYIFVVLALFFTGCSQKEVPLEKEPQVSSTTLEQENITQPKKQTKYSVFKFQKSSQVELNQPQDDGSFSDLDEQEDQSYDTLFREYLVKNSLEQLNKRNAPDCSGLVTLINSKTSEAYFDKDELDKYFTNSRKSKALFNLAKSKDRFANEPNIGDLVFFEDTIAGMKRRIGAQNITHVGIVTKIDEDKTVHFIHNIGGKNVMGALNLEHPKSAKLGKKIVNTPLKRCPRSQQNECLSGALFSSFATPTIDEITLSKK